MPVVNIPIWSMRRISQDTYDIFRFGWALIRRDG